MKLIDADTVVEIRLYDDEKEEFGKGKMSIKEALDLVTEEGCPEAIDWIPCEKELPKHNVEVWVTVEGQDIIIRQIGESKEEAAARGAKLRWVVDAYLTKEGWWSNTLEGPIASKVIAWQKKIIPKAYGGCLCGQ